MPEWGGGNTALLARIRDAEGCWLCSWEVYNKLCPSVSQMTWHIDYYAGELTPRVFPQVLKNVQFLIPGCWWGVAVGHDPKPATCEELRYLTAVGATDADEGDALL